MKTEYQAITIFRSGHRMLTQGRKSFKTKQAAIQAIKETIRHDTKYQRCGMIGIELEDTGKEEPYDIVGFEIKSRQVTEWETESIEI